MLRILDSFDISRETRLRQAADIRLVQRHDGLCTVVHVDNGIVSNLDRSRSFAPYGERAVSYVAAWTSEARARSRFTRTKRQYEGDGE